MGFLNRIGDSYEIQQFAWGGGIGAKIDLIPTPKKSDAPPSRIVYELRKTAPVSFVDEDINDYKLEEPNQLSFYVSRNGLSMQKQEVLFDPISYDDISDIVYGNGIFVMSVIRNCGVLTSYGSTDRIELTLVYPIDSFTSIYDGNIVFGNGIFFFVRGDVSYLSENGKDWTPSSAHIGEGFPVMKDPSFHIVCLYDGYFIWTYNRYMFRSANGIDWERLPYIVDEKSNVYYPQVLIAGDGVILILCYNKKYRLDGWDGVWEKEDFDGTQYCQIFFSGNRFVMYHHCYYAYGTRYGWYNAILVSNDRGKTFPCYSYFDQGYSNAFTAVLDEKFLLMNYSRNWLLPYLRLYDLKTLGYTTPDFHITFSLGENFTCRCISQGIWKGKPIYFFIGSPDGKTLVSYTSTTWNFVDQTKLSECANKIPIDEIDDVIYSKGTFFFWDRNSPNVVCLEESTWYVLQKFQIFHTAIKRGARPVCYGIYLCIYNSGDLYPMIIWEQVPIKPNVGRYYIGWTKSSSPVYNTSSDEGVLYSSGIFLFLIFIRNFTERLGWNNITIDADKNTTAKQPTYIDRSCNHTGKNLHFVFAHDRNLLYCEDNDWVAVFDNRYSWSGYIQLQEYGAIPGYAPGDRLSQLYFDGTQWVCYGFPADSSKGVQRYTSNDDGKTWEAMDFSIPGYTIQTLERIVNVEEPDRSVLFVRATNGEPLDSPTLHTVFGIKKPNSNWAFLSIPNSLTIHIQFYHQGKISGILRSFLYSIHGII